MKTFRAYRRESHIKGPTAQLHNQPQSKKERKVYRIKKGKSPEAKRRWDNLRKAS